MLNKWHGKQSIETHLIVVVELPAKNGLFMIISWNSMRAFSKSENKIQLAIKLYTSR